MSKEEKVKNIKIVRESLIESLLSDISTFSLMLVTFYLNYKFIDGNNFIDAVLLLAILCKGVGNGKVRNYSGIKEKELKKIEKILEES